MPSEALAKEGWSSFASLSFARVARFGGQVPSLGGARRRMPSEALAKEGWSSFASLSFARFRVLRRASPLRSKNRPDATGLIETAPIARGNKPSFCVAARKLRLLSRGPPAASVPPTRGEQTE